MKQLHLKFTDEAQAKQVLATCPERLTVVHLGTLYNEDGVYNEETGEVITPATAKEGWHVDVLIDTHCTILDEYDVKPETPVHTFAGFKQ